MKATTIVSALLVAVAGVWAPSIADASCQNICVRELVDCRASGSTEESCQLDLALCLEGCAGGGSVRSLAPAGEDAHGSATSCAETESAATGRALLALLRAPGDHADVGVSRLR